VDDPDLQRRATKRILEAHRSRARYVAPVNHGNSMEFHLFSQGPAVTLENGNHFSGQTLLQGLPGFAIASFKDPFYCELRSLLLAQSNGFHDILRAMSMG